MLTGVLVRLLPHFGEAAHGTVVRRLVVAWTELVHVRWFVVGIPVGLLLGRYGVIVGIEILFVLMLSCTKLIKFPI